MFFHYEQWNLIYSSIVKDRFNIYASRIVSDSVPHRPFHVRNSTELHSFSGGSTVSLSLSFAVSVRIEFVASVYLIGYIFPAVPSIWGIYALWAIFSIAVFNSRDRGCSNVVYFVDSVTLFRVSCSVVFRFHSWNVISLVLNSPNRNSLCRI